MLKKGLLVGAGVLLVLGLLFGRSGLTYLKTSVSDIRQAVDENIPIETKISVARAEIERLDPVIKDLAFNIAKEEIKIKRMTEEVAQKEAQLAKDQEHIDTLTNHLRNGSSVYVVKTAKGSQSFSNNVVESDLRSCFENFKTNKATIEKMTQIIEARRQGLQAARENYDETKLARHELDVQIENLQARHKMIQVAQVSSEFHHDNSQLARTRELIDNIEGRIETEELLTHMEPTDTRIPRADEYQDSGDILQEVTTYFGTADGHFVAENNK